MQCLDDYRHRMADFLAALTRDDVPSIAAAVPAVESLPDPGQCPSVSHMLTLEELPENPEERAAVSEIRSALGRVEMLSHARHLAEAREVMDDLLPRARATGHSPLIARALHLAGTLDMLLTESQRARKQLEEAVLVAEETAHDEIHARALVSLTMVEASYSSNRSKIGRVARRAAAAARRYGRDPLLQGRLDLIQARLLSDEGAFEQSLPLFDDARRAFVEAGARLEAAQIALLSVNAHLALGQPERAFELAEKAHAETLGRVGDNHPLTVMAREVSFWPLSALGRYDEARTRAGELAAFWHSATGQKVLAGTPLPADRTDRARERTIAGTVVDGDGNPAAGAEVVIARHLLSDGKYLVHSQDGREFHRLGLQTATSDSAGRFSFAAVPGVEMLAAAESDRGRSFPVVISPEGSRDDLVLDLRPFGSAKGQLAGLLQPAEASLQYMVMFQPASDSHHNPARVVVFAHEGRFEIPRLAAGRYNVVVASGIEGNFFAQEVPDVEVSAGETLDLAVPVGVGGKRVAVRIRGKYGVPIPAAQILLIPGSVSLRTVAELDQMLTTRGRAGLFTGYRVATGESDRGGDGPLVIELAPVPAGSYSACVIPFGGDPKDVEFLRRMMEHREELEIHCQSVEVKSEPDEQSVALEVPPMKPFSTPGVGE